MEYTFTTDNFETEVLGSDVPVLVDFWATDTRNPARPLQSIRRSTTGGVMRFGSR